jgi:lysyl-tRNA synthetase class 2
VGDDMAAGIDLLDELAQSLLHTLPAKRTTYAAAFQAFASICPHSATLEQLAAAASSVGIDIPNGLDRCSRDEWLNLILAMQIEPQLGRERPEILYQYPASQAALAKTTTDEFGNQVAERFELYYRGIELANGYHELADAAELRRRFEAVNSARVADGRTALPIPEKWLASISIGLPPCTGVALGFDRLAMLALNVSSVDDVIAFPLPRR